MATLRDIRGRIGGVKNTQQITKAMKMVAAAKLRKAQDQMLAARPYSAKIKDLLLNLTQDDSVKSHPLIADRKDVINIAFVVITADRGLCGAFNTNLLKAAMRKISSEFKTYRDTGHLHLIPVGRVGHDFFKRRGFVFPYHGSGLFQHLSLSEARAVNDHLVNGYLSGKYDKVVVMGNRFKNVVTPIVTDYQHLPIPQDVNETDHEADKPAHHANYLYEPDIEGIVSGLIPQYLQQQIWQMLLESYASEQGSRMTAMDTATENAKELIKTLTLSYNRLRQAAITTEIIEIVSGAESLNQ